MQCLLRSCRRNSAYPGFRNALNLFLVLHVLGAILAPWIAYTEAGLRQGERIKWALLAVFLNICVLILVCFVWHFLHAFLDIADSLLRRDLHGSPGTVARDALD